MVNLMTCPLPFWGRSGEGREIGSWSVIDGHPGPLFWGHPWHPPAGSSLQGRGARQAVRDCSESEQAAYPPLHGSMSVNLITDNLLPCKVQQIELPP